MTRHSPGSAAGNASAAGPRHSSRDQIPITLWKSNGVLTTRNRSGQVKPSNR
jgi:hypothetical protein